MNGYKTTTSKKHYIIPAEILDVSAPTINDYENRDSSYTLLKLEIEDFENTAEESFLEDLRLFLEEEFILNFKNAQAKIVDSDEEFYDKILVLKLNENVTSQKLNKLFSKAVSKGSNYSKKHDFLDYFDKILISVTR